MACLSVNKQTFSVIFPILIVLFLLTPGRMKGTLQPLKLSLTPDVEQPIRQIPSPRRRTQHVRGGGWSANPSLSPTPLSSFGRVMSCPREQSSRTGCPVEAIESDRSQVASGIYERGDEPGYQEIFFVQNNFWGYKLCPISNLTFFFIILTMGCLSICYVIKLRKNYFIFVGVPKVWIRLKNSSGWPQLL